MKLYTPDGHCFEGKTYSDVVSVMCGSKFDKPESRASYRKATCKRVKELWGLGIEIDTEGDESFIRSLVKAGLLTYPPVKVHISNESSQSD